MKCPNCGQICRNNRETCALCGTPLTQKRSYGWLIALIIFLVLVAASLLAYQFWLKDLLLAPREQQTAQETVPTPEPERSPLEPETGEAAPAEEPAPLTEAEETAPAESPEPTYQVIEIPVATPERREDFLFDDAAEIFAEPSYSLALCRDGSVKLAGQSASPEFGFDLFDWANIKQLIPTEYFIAGLTQDGRVRLTGEVGGYEEAARWTDVYRLFYDAGILLGLTSDGRVLAAGPELNFDPSELKDIVNIIPGRFDTLAVSVDGRVSYLKRTGALWDAEGKYNLADVAIGPDFVLYLMEDGTVNISSMLWRTIENYNQATPAYFSWENICQLEIADHIVAGLTRDGQVLCATHLYGESTPDTSSWTGVSRLIPDPSRDTFFGLTEDGRVLVTPESGAKKVSSWKNIVDLQVNQYYIVGLTADGHVLTLAREGAPAVLKTEEWETVSALSLGVSHLLALQEDGTVLAAGDNSFGQCG